MPGQLRDRRVPHQLGGQLHVVPRDVELLELIFVDRAPIAGVADQPPFERQQTVERRDRLGIAAGIGLRLPFLEQGVGERGQDLERAIVELDRLVELLERDVVRRKAVRHPRPALAPLIRAQQVLDGVVDLRGERRAHADEVVELDEAWLCLQQILERRARVAGAYRGLELEKGGVAPGRHDGQPVRERLACGGDVRAVERQPEIGGQRILVRVETQRLRPGGLVPQRRLIAGERGVVGDAARAATRRQRVGDLEQERQGRVVRRRRRGQFVRFSQIAAVLGAEIALADGEQCRRAGGAGGRGSGEGGDRAQGLVFAKRREQAVEAAGANQRVRGGEPF